MDDNIFVIAGVAFIVFYESSTNNNGRSAFFFMYFTTLLVNNSGCPSGTMNSHFEIDVFH
jgi:hypothetical protein